MKKTLTLLTYVLVMVLLAVGCGQPAAPSSPSASTVTEASSAAQTDTPATEKKPESYSGTLSLWTQDGTTDTAMVEAFNKVYPNIKVNVTPVTENYPVKLATALASGTGVPDVVTLEFSFVSKFVETDQFEDLGSAPYNGAAYEENMVSYMYALGKNTRGQQIGMPVDPAPAGLFYRRDLALKYLGTDDPAEVSKLVPTWEALFEVGKKVRDMSDGKVSILANAGNTFNMMRYQTGKKWIDENLKVTIEQDFLASTKLLHGAVAEGLFAKMNDWDTPWYSSFSMGNVMFYPEGIWLSGYVIKENDKEGSGRWGVASFPNGCINRGGVNLAIPKASENKELAWEFVKWYTTTLDAALTTNRMTGGLTSWKPAYENETYKKADEFMGGQHVVEFFVNEMNNNMIIPPVTPYDPILDSALGAYMQPFAEGEMAPEELLRLVTDDILQQIPNSSR